MKAQYIKDRNTEMLRLKLFGNPKAFEIRLAIVNIELVLKDLVDLRYMDIDIDTHTDIETEVDLLIQVWISVSFA